MPGTGGLSKSSAARVLWSDADLVTGSGRSMTAMTGVSGAGRDPFPTASGLPGGKGNRDRREAQGLPGAARAGRQVRYSWPSSSEAVSTSMSMS